MTLAPLVAAVGRLTKDRWLSGAILVAALHAIVTFWTTHGSVELMLDSMDYAEAARSLVQGEGDTINRIFFHTGLFPAIRHPLEVHGLLHPTMVASLFLVFGPLESLVRVPSILFGSGLIVLVFWVARRMFDLRAALVAASLILLRGDLVVVSAAGVDDVAEAFLGFAALSCFAFGAECQKRPWFVLAGVFAAGAALEKVTGLVVAPVFLAALVVSGATRRAVGLQNLLFSVVPSIPVFGLYALRNYRVYGSFGSPYGALEWLGKNDVSAYFAFYETPPVTREVWSRLGFERVIGLIDEQIRLLGAYAVWDPLLPIGLLLVVSTVRRKPAFASATLLFALAIVFLVCVLHHVESRYLWSLLPSSAVALGGAVASGLSWMDRRARTGRTALLAKAVVVVGTPFALAPAPRVFTVAYILGSAPRREGVCDDAGRYIRAKVKADAVVLTSNPWYVSWTTERAAVNAPTNGDEAVLRVVRHYGADWALTGGTVYGGLDLAAALASPTLSQALRPLPAFKGKHCDVYRLQRLD